MTPDAATYVFCLVQSVRPPSLRGVPDSVPGAGAPRLIAVDRDVWAVVADAPLERFGGEQLRDELQDVEAISRHALAHASVIEFFFRRAPVIPLKLFTLFSADDRVRQHLETRLTRLRKLFEELRGLEEWGVRVITGDGGGRFGEIAQERARLPPGEKAACTIKAGAVSRVGERRPTRR